MSLTSDQFGGIITVFAVRLSVGELCTEGHERKIRNMHEGLADVDRRVVGTKQLLRALDEGKIARAFVAKDADLLLTKRVVDRCFEKNIPCTQVDTMEQLGRACGIDVKAAAAGLFK